MSAAAAAAGAPSPPAKPTPGFASLLSTIRTVKYEHLVAGISGGVVSTLVLHPLDLLKIRFAGMKEDLLASLVLTSLYHFSR